jgi:hypothetical protein
VASSVFRAIKPSVTQVTLKIMYHSYSYSLINYGIIFWEIPHIATVFLNYKTTTIVGTGIRDSCREFFKILNILPLISQYIFSLVLFVVNNKNQFRMNSEIHSINTRNNSNFHQPLSYLTVYQESPFICILRYIAVFHLK